MKFLSLSMVALTMLMSSVVALPVEELVSSLSLMHALPMLLHILISLTLAQRSLATKLMSGSWAWASVKQRSDAWHRAEPEIRASTTLQDSATALATRAFLRIRRVWQIGTFCRESCCMEPGFSGRRDLKKHIYEQLACAGVPFSNFLFELVTSEIWPEWQRRR